MRLVAMSGNLTGQQLDFSTSKNVPTTGFVDGNSGSIQFGARLEAAGSDGLDTTANVANWGVAELVYARSVGAAIIPGTLVHLDKDFNITTVPNTGLTGRPVFVTLTNFADGTTTPQGGWLLRSGICPVKYAVAATAGAVYISGTAGQATPTNPTGQKQILNATCLIAAVATFTTPVTARTGSKQLRVKSTAGMYPGQAISTPANTPVPAGSTIVSLDPSGQFITVNNAAIASATAVGTFTNTGYGICHVDDPAICPAVN